MLRSKARSGLVTLLVLAFASLGFGHTAERADRLALQTAASLLGAEICGAGKSGHVSASCEACRLVSAAALPPQAFTLVSPDRSFAGAAAICDETRVFARKSPGPQVRAPPV